MPFSLLTALLVATTVPPDAQMGDGLRDQPRSTSTLGADLSPALICPDGPTLYGIDVSKWQGSINWAAVAADGVKFAFIRASDGTGYIDEYFHQNWEQAKQNGITVGAYQFFRPNQNPTAQAELLLEMMGTLGPEDLPPVIDVEATGGLGPGAIASAISEWLSVVEPAVGAKPFVYTSPGWWNGNVNSPDFGDLPLWVAHWGTNCPSMPNGWSDFVFHQTSDSGSVGGLSPVDENVFNGDAAALDNWTLAPVVCGDGICSASESADTCLEDCPPCGVIGPEGGIIDDQDACCELYGDPEYWREEAAGFGGHLVWTHTTDWADPANYVFWRLFFEQGGEYEVLLHLVPEFSYSTQARYKVRAGGMQSNVQFNQSTADGWYSLGVFSFAAGGDQFMRLDDNTGESNEAMVRLGVDAVSFEPLVEGTTGDSGDDTSDTDDPTDDTTDDTTDPDPTGDPTLDPTTGSTGSLTGEDSSDETSGGASDSAALPPDFGQDDGGCGCRQQTPNNTGLLLLLLAGGLVRRRRAP